MSATITSNISTSVWTIDPAHTVVEFKVRHMMISNVKGRFPVVAGELILDGADVRRSRIIATIDAASIDTGDPQRDTHLKSADFLAVEEFPTLSFASSRISRRGAGELEVEGELTIHGVNRKVVLAVEGPSTPAKDPWGKLRIGVSASATIDRKAFGLLWNSVIESGGLLIGDQVTISVEAQFVQP
jgi:polyisoprenoid-binding protein YceI